ncbi:hypothetical protein ACQVP2_01270 [Methylobacterium aquaticum]|jgi:hypothetical protein|uniref:Uncharacterized protein n=1 Tax=Methylobacterium aquaticum TaxID=270351 RepID=A0A0J6SGA5_9HYPH|nr:hypothetical protein [Methylobacterium aquaticum]KMO32699.1 hypothetical protein VP06_17205 [Methylobacterium aquaticum]
MQQIHHGGQMRRSRLHLAASEAAGRCGGVQRVSDQGRIILGEHRVERGGDPFVAVEVVRRFVRR